MIPSSQQRHFFPTTNIHSFLSLALQLSLTLSLSLSLLISPLLLPSRSLSKVLRRYSRFDSLYENLVVVMDARGRDVSELPPLPAKKFLGRSHVRKVAEERIAPLNAFLEGA